MLRVEERMEGTVDLNGAELTIFTPAFRLSVPHIPHLLPTSSLMVPSFGPVYLERLEAIVSNPNRLSFSMSPPRLDKERRHSMPYQTSEGTGGTHDDAKFLDPVK